MNRRELIANASLITTVGIAGLLSKGTVNAAPAPGVALIDRLVEAINSRELSKLDQVYAAGSGSGLSRCHLLPRSQYASD